MLLTLSQLMQRHGTDKCDPHRYDVEYTRHFEPLREWPIRLLEIGVGGSRSNDVTFYGDPLAGGQSLRVWRDYFPLGEIHGLDIHDKSRLDLGPRITIHRGDQNNPGDLEHLSASASPFDIVIDDGSHVQEHSVTSFNTLFPLMNPGGIYVIEDIGTAYEWRYGGHPDPLRFCQRCLTSINLLAWLIDGLHADSWPDRIPSELQGMVASVHVSKNIAFIYKVS